MDLKMLNLLDIKKCLLYNSKYIKKDLILKYLMDLIKSFCRIQTRYDKNSNIFLNTIILGCIYRILYNMEKIKF